jgi:predicted nucleic acid-binding protein
MNSALLDTSFLISLTSQSRPNHGVAKRYFRELIDQAVPMHLSTIVISEFEVRQRIRDLGLHNFIVVPFNIDHAIATASLSDAGQRARSDDQTRVSVKDDVKLIAQCEIAGITHLLTDDKPLRDWLDRMRRSHSARALPFGVCLGDGFSSSWFNAANQGGLLPADEEEDDENDELS